jgi:parallel beta-helix repeat protein
MSKRYHCHKLILAGLLCCTLLLPGTGLSPTYAAPVAPRLVGDPRSHQLLPNGQRSSLMGQAAEPTYQLIEDAKAQPTIEVTGAGATVTLADIKQWLDEQGGAHKDYLVVADQVVWHLNVNLLIGANVTLNLGPQSGVQELRLRSEASPVTAGAAGAIAAQVIEDAHGEQVTAAIDDASFVYLRTHDGTMNLDGVKLYSWDPANATYDLDIFNGRAYVLARHAATLNIRNSELMYLGSADGESYGVAWRDLNDLATPDVLQTRVTGEVLDSLFHHNYYGVYTFQASQMVFRGNQFYDNIRYGFDPHDFSHDVLVENNQAYNNGSHGFILSRGCHHFILRNNKSYNNHDPDPVRGAQGFMLDPGAPPIEPTDSAQVPSSDNLLENNEAYGNEGFGLRILGSLRNQIRNNYFHENEQGIVVDRESPDNTVSGNRLTNHTLHGLVVRETADRTLITNNTIELNQNHGLYVRSNHNVISGNTVNGNRQTGITFLPPPGQTAALSENQVLSNTLAGNTLSGLDLRNAVQTVVQANLIENNAQGIYLSDGATQNIFVGNVIRTNQTYGIRATGLETVDNHWSENQIYANLGRGIFLSNGANRSLAAPQLLTFAGNTLSGLATPGVTVELFSDHGDQGQFFEGRTTAAANGRFRLTLAGSAQAAYFTAVAIDERNASPFSAPPLSMLTPTPTVTPTPSPTPTATATATPRPTVTATATATPTPTVTVVEQPPSETNPPLYFPLVTNG